VSEWTKYRLGFPSSPNGRFTEGTVLETVHHVAHVADARRILEDGFLKAGLVHDESKLKKSRIAVTWLSANTWAHGSIYGNVQFSFSWKKQAAQKRVYWVEAMPSYQPPAYRILLSDRDLHSKYVQPYDPSSAKGPLRKRSGIWYWNGDYTSEFLLEGDIPLDHCTGFDFVSHHGRYCGFHGQSCGYLGSRPDKAAGRVLSALLGSKLHAIDHVLNRRSRFDSDRKLSDAVDTGIIGIMSALGSNKRQLGGVVRSAAFRKSVVRGALSLYGSGQTKAARELVALLKSRSTFEEALTEIVNEHFEITGWRIE